MGVSIEQGDAACEAASGRSALRPPPSAFILPPSHQPPALPQIPLGAQEADQGEEEGPRVPEDLFQDLSGRGQITDFR
jgi:hypothetical protein